MFKSVGADRSAGVEQHRWVGRCVESLSELCPAIAADEARLMAQAMWTIPRFRSRGPDAVAALLAGDSISEPA
ncbi:hypothetical protein [Piscinibacter sp. XHJ-5]|uniref:hypothetical protein n=1 Tax=Piscinibacter sp. XHJ-5 TaxID=3037797 RepID=UPI00245323B0|nr:hypothetical protein [Piscinibacter sp. XHJ-5]